MNKPKLLYASPFPPLESGISDYSVILVDALKENFDITLFSDNYKITDEALKKFPVLKYGVDSVDFDSFDHIIYNMGNNGIFHSYIYETALKHPGVIIQHDLVIFHFIMRYYRADRKNLYSALYSSFSVKDFICFREAVRDKYENTMDFASGHPFNTELLRSGNRFITHSEYARNKILETGIVKAENVAHINLIEQIADDAVIIDREKLYKKYKVPADAAVICAFGNILETKLNRETCRAVKKFAAKSDKKLCYVMVGKGDYVDDELEDGLIIKTGYTELDEFNSFVNYADIIVNLRNPTLGETSAAMLRTLQMGKVCITNNGGWFSELPDDCVCKIELDNAERNIEKALTELLSDEDKCIRMSRNASEYVRRECSAEVICRKMTEFIVG